mgnify:FL=1|tara:strand:- start:2873 stop:3835 length:963 start_codon:yes stop_codon:yes gene_type:complete
MNEINSKAKIIFSIDTELAWARIHHRNLEDYTELLGEYRNAVDWLLESFEEYDIQATWAIVGHLFLDHCEEPTHPDITRPDYDWVDGDWYQYDPCSNHKDAPFFYAPDIIEKIRENRIDHEIGSHSFAHINFSDSGCSYDAAFDDLAMCQKLSKEVNNSQLESFVFPQDKVGNLEALSDAGFKVYRGAGIYDDIRASSKIRKLFHTLGVCLGLPNEPVSITKNLGLYNLPLSNHYRLERPSVLTNPYSFVPLFSKYLSVKNSIRRAIKMRKIAHIGLHPIDFGLNSEKYRNHFKRILEFISKSRSNNEIDVMTMSDAIDH